MTQSIFIFIIAITFSLPSLAKQESLYTYVEQEIASKSDHVQKFEWNHKTFWFKRPEPAKTSWYYKFLKNTLSKFIPITFLRPSPYKDETLLMQEVTRLKECEKHHLKCPRLIEQAQEWIVISDVGIPSEQVIASLPPQKRLDFAIKLLAALQENHTKGFIHGRASLKDILVDTKGYVYLIDFEEDPRGHLSLSDAKARDIFFFLFSALPFLSQSDHLKLKDHLEAVLDPLVARSLLSITKYKPFFTIFEPFKNHLGKDPKRFFLTLEFLYYFKDIEN